MLPDLHQNITHQTRGSRPATDTMQVPTLGLKVVTSVPAKQASTQSQGGKTQHITQTHEGKWRGWILQATMEMEYGLKVLNRGFGINATKRKGVTTLSLYSLFCRLWRWELWLQHRLRRQERKKVDFAVMNMPLYEHTQTHLMRQRPIICWGVVNTPRSSGLSRSWWTTSTQAETKELCRCERSKRLHWMHVLQARQPDRQCQLVLFGRQEEHQHLAGHCPTNGRHP